MTDKDNGGAVYACAGPYTESRGISLRDHLAMNATENDLDSFRYVDHKLKFTREQARYRFADAMIAARSE